MLVRELREELGITIEAGGEPFAKVQGRDFRMDVWTIDRWTGHPSTCGLQEHDALAWVDGDEARGLRLADSRLLRLLHAALEASE